MFASLVSLLLLVTKSQWWNWVTEMVNWKPGWLKFVVLHYEYDETKIFR